MYVIISRQVKEIAKYTNKHLQQPNLFYLLEFSIGNQSMAAFYASSIRNIQHQGTKNKHYESIKTYLFGFAK